MAPPQGELRCCHACPIHSTPASLYTEFLTELRVRQFEGDLAPGYGDRMISATDNSIYQLLPQAIVFPRGTEDLVRIARVAAEPRFAELIFAPRGGGTGTNGQSLTEGLVVDLSRHMNRILEINVEQRLGPGRGRGRQGPAQCRPGPHGLFFPPELSTSNRATIGGMISTDACGQGSCLYGKTRDHVLELTTVLLDGTVWTSYPLEEEELARVRRRSDRVGEVHRLVDDIQREQAEADREPFSQTQPMPYRL